LNHFGEYKPLQVRVPFTLKDHEYAGLRWGHEVFRVGTSRHTGGQPDSLGRGSFLDGCSPPGPGAMPLEEGRWE